MEEDWVTLEVGDKAPDFDALLTDGSQISLNDISVSYTHLTLPTILLV